MNEITCEWTRDLLPEYALGELDTAQGSAIDGHLVACDVCRRELDLVNALRDLRVDVPAGLDTRVVGAAVTRRRAGVWSPGRIAMAATVAFALITAGLVWRSSGNGERARTEVAGPATVDWNSGDPAILRDGLDLGSLSEDELLKLIEELDS